jgi:hypothetical protein
MNPSLLILNVKSQVGVCPDNKPKIYRQVSTPSRSYFVQLKCEFTEVKCTYVHIFSTTKKNQTESDLCLWTGDRGKRGKSGVGGGKWDRGKDFF